MFSAWQSASSMSSESELEEMDVNPPAPPSTSSTSREPNDGKHWAHNNNKPSTFEDIRGVQRMSREIISHVIEPLQHPPHSVEGSVVQVKGWDGVGTWALIQYVTHKIDDALKSVKKRAYDVPRKFHIENVNIAKEDEPLSMASKIRQAQADATRTLISKHYALHYIFIVNSSSLLQDVSLEWTFLLFDVSELATFVIPTLQVSPRGQLRAIVSEAFDSLSNEEALWLLQHEAQYAADAVCRRHHHNTVAAHGRPLHPTLINGAMALDCFLYCTLVPDLFDSAHCWMAEDLLGEDGLEYYSPAATRLAHDLMTEFQHRCMLQIFDPYGYIVRVTWPLVSKVASVFSLCEEQRGRGVISEHSSHLTEFSLKTVQEQRREAAKDIYRISLANNSITKLVFPSPRLSECFPNLRTLLLNDNPLLDEMPDDVFSPHMPNLRLLDLSGTSIAKLPSSLSKCCNLRMLSLNGCKQLETLFPLFETCLDHLEVLSLECTPLNNITKLSIPYKPNFKILRFYSAFDKLQEFDIFVGNGRVFEDYLAPRRREWYWTAPLKSAHIVVSCPEDAEKRDRSNFIQKKFPLYRDVLEQIKSNVYPRLADIETSYNRRLEIHGSDENVLGYNIAHSICFPDFISLWNNQADVQMKLDDFKELKNLRIEKCHQMRTAFSVGLEEIQLKNVYLSFLQRMRYICSSTVSSLAHLKSIHIECCQQLAVLFTGSSVKLPMLEELEIKFCAKLWGIFSGEIDCKAYGETHLPRLQRLCLCELPNMTSICDGYLPLTQLLKVRGCWKLRKLPLITTTLNAARDPIVKMIKVEGEQSWWNSVVGNRVFDKNKINFVTPF